MNAFQLVALIGLSFLIGITVIASIRGWATRREALFWSLLFLAMAVGIAWPDVTVRAAEFVGIGRGADLVFYCGVIVMIVGFWMVYIRLRLLRRQLTLLVRKLAILEGQKEYPKESK